MTVVLSLKNSRSFDPLCQFNVYRYGLVDTGLGIVIANPCKICIQPSVLCNLVEIERVWTLDNVLGDWGYTFANPSHTTLFTSFFGAGVSEYDIPYDGTLRGCHWNISDNDTAAGVTGEIVYDIQVTRNADLIDLYLRATINITGSVQDSKQLIYTKAQVETTDLGPIVFTTTETLTGRTFNISGSSDQIIFPSSFSVTAEDP